MKTVAEVSLKAFYARRAIRLFPAAYAYIACIAILSTADLIHVRVKDFLYAATYTVNYLPFPTWQIGHLWSLSVEEQFYMLWPFLFTLFKPKRSTWIAVTVIFLAPMARLAAWRFLSGSPYRNLEMLPMVADSLAMGCILARGQKWLEYQGWYLQMFKPIYSLGLLALVLLINRYTVYTFISVFGYSLINLEYCNSRSPLGILFSRYARAIPKLEADSICGRS